MRTTKIEIDIKLIVPNRWNPNVQSKEIFEKGVKSVETFGMLSCPLVRETAGCYEIIDGEHRWRYCKKLEHKTIWVENLGEISDQEAKTLTILLNNLRGKDDIEKRAKILKKLNEGQLQLLPFTKEEIKNELELVNFDFSQYEKEDKIPERVITNNLIFPLTEEERKVWDLAFKRIKEKNSKVTEIQIFLTMLKEYLWITWGVDIEQVKKEDQEKLSTPTT
jgi:ParB-like chromosome segregation protein Spo0J